MKRILFSLLLIFLIAIFTYANPYMTRIPNESIQLALLEIAPITEDVPSGAVSWVTSVEHVNIDLTATETTESIALSKSQTEANCVPFVSCYLSGTSDARASIYCDVDIWLDGSTPKVRATRNSSAGEVHLSIYVVEFDSSYITVQEGTFNIADTASTGNDTITAVTLAKAFMVFTYQTAHSADDYNDTTVEGWFSSTTQVDFSRSTGTDGAISGHYYVVEAQNTEFAVIQERWTMTETGSSEESGAFGPVVMANTFVVGSYCTTYDTDDSIMSWTLDLSDTTRCYARGGGSTTSDLGFTAFVIESTDLSVQRGSWTYGAGETSKSTDITEIDQNKAICNNPMILGHSQENSTTSEPNEATFHRLQFTDSDTIEAAHDGSGTGGGDGYWEVIEFP